MTIRKTRSKKTNIKKQTIGQFKAWIEGVEELQSNDWCPDANQWNLIRSRIDRIVDPELERTIADLDPRRSQFGVGIVQPQLIAAGIPTSPPVSGGVPNGEIVNKTSAAMLQHGTPENPKKTPNVEGNFGSPFA